MGLFDFFKDKEVDHTIMNMKKGYMVDYFMQTWEVTKVYKYNWGNNFYSFEYLLDSGREKVYLGVEDDDELILTLCKKIKLTEIDAGLAAYIKNNDDAPDRLVYNNKTYSRSESSQGLCKEDGADDDSASEFVNWMFEDESGEEFVSIDRWGEEEFAAAHGNYVKEIEFSNILPR